MAALIIDTNTELRYYEMQVDLEGATYLLTFRFSDREGVWYVDVADADGVAIRSGVKVVLGAALLRPVTDPRRPPGDFAAIDSSGTGQEAGPGELGERVVLGYIESADLAQLGT
jgi:hypothetical protein